MAIQRKPKGNTRDIDVKAVEKFVDGAGIAPSRDVTKSPMKAKPPKEKKVLISLRFQPELLDAIDQMAKRRGTSRSGLISYWCSKGVEGE